MFLNTLDVKLISRKDSDHYRVIFSDSTLNILKLILEFKICTGWHISRFVSQKDESRYIYMKLRRMWQAGLLESFKVFSDSFVGASLFYMLSKQGLAALAEYAHYGHDHNLLKTYPKAKTLLDWGLFKHEAQVVELASMEAKNKVNGLSISFKGEVSSKSLDYMSGRHIEVLTPDYTVYYKIGDTEGSQNTAVGYSALYTASSTLNTGLGYNAGNGVTTGANNVILGASSGTNIGVGSNNIIIGYNLGAPIAGNSNQLYIGGILYGDISTGNIGIATTTPAAKLDVNGTSIIIEQSATPASSSAACTKGTISWDSGFVYVCVSANTWKRAAITTW